MPAGTSADIRHSRCDDLLGRGEQKYAFRMLRRKLASRVGRAGLVQHGCALRRGLRQMDRVYPIVLAFMDYTTLWTLSALVKMPLFLSRTTAPPSQLPSHSLYMTSMYSSAIRYLKSWLF